MDQQAFLAGYNFQKKAWFEGVSPGTSALYTGLAAAPLGGALGYFTAGEKESPWKKALYYGLISGAAGGLAGHYLPDILGTAKKMKTQEASGISGEFSDNIANRATKSKITYNEQIAKELPVLRVIQDQLEKIPSGSKTTKINEFIRMSDTNLKKLLNTPGGSGREYVRKMMEEAGAFESSSAWWAEIIKAYFSLYPRL